MSNVPNGGEKDSWQLDDLCTQSEHEEHLGP